MRNERTPRTLADASFVIGYSAAEFSKSPPWIDRLAGIALAIVIGAAVVALVLAELGAL